MVYPSMSKRCIIHSSHFIVDIDTGRLFRNSLVQDTKLVQMSIDNTIHYRPGWPTIEDEWERLLPSGGHLVFDVDEGSEGVYTPEFLHPYVDTVSII